MYKVLNMSHCLQTEFIYLSMSSFAVLVNGEKSVSSAF